MEHLLTKNEIAYTLVEWPRPDAFWIGMGPYSTSKVVHKELEGALTDSQQHEWILAWRDTAVVGFTNMEIDKLRNNIRFIATYVVGGYRHQGIAIQLFDLRLQRAEALGRRPFVIKGLTPHPYIRRMFERHGFTLYQQRGKWAYYKREYVNG